MTHFNVQDYKGQLLGLAVTIGIGGLFVPNAAIKTGIIASMTGVSIGSLIAYKASQSSTNYQLSKYIQNNELKINTEDNRVKELTKQLTNANHDRTKLKGELSQKQSDFNVLSALNTSNVNKLKELSKLANEHEHLKQQINALTNELARANQDLATVRTNLINKLTSHLENTTRWIIKQIETKLKLDDYKTIHVQLADLLDYVNTKYDNHLNLLVKVEASNNFAEMMVIALQIMDESTGLKVRYNKTLNIDNVKALEAYMENESKLVSKDKASQAMTMLKQKLDANYTGTIDKIKGNDQNLANLWANVQDLIGQIDSKNLEIDSLKHQLIELQKPQKWTLASSNRVLDIGNKIIEFFWTNTGVILDRTYSESDEYVAKLYFQIDRNSRGILPKELSEHSEALQQFCRLLNPVKFEYDANKALIFAEVVLKIREKVKPSKDDIDKLWIPVSRFEQTVKGWSRIRITGGSESGKSPTAENIACVILKHRAGVAKLFNPQHNSDKNYWTIPVVGVSHADSEKGIKALAKKVDARSNGAESRELFELALFDEIDSTMSHTHKSKASIADDVCFVIKQASHQNLGAVFIGQNANVTEYPGMDRSDWNSAVNVHIGANASDALTNTNLLTSEESENLKGVVARLTAFCNEKNEELGLHDKHPNAYRFALVMEPGKRPYFIQLPDFGSYTYTKNTHTVSDNILSSENAAKAANNAGNPDSTVQQNDSKTGYRGVSCLSCQEGILSPSSTVKGVQYYKCDTCGKKTSENVLRKKLG